MKIKVSVSSQLIMLAAHQDIHFLGWSDQVLLLLDYYSAQKTPMKRNILRNLGFTLIFSTSASIKAIPIEYVFGAQKTKDHLIIVYTLI